MTPTSGEDGLPIVELRFESLRNLQEDLGPYLAQEGLFLRGKTEFGPSDVVRFRIMLPGDFVLVEGAGVIIWVRGQSETGPLDPAGAAMGFATLSEQGRELVEQIVQTHCDGGGRPFDLTRPATSGGSKEDQGEKRPARGDLAGLRLTVRSEPEPVSTPATGAAGAVAGAEIEVSSPEAVEESPSLPFADDPIEQPAVDVDEAEEVLREQDEIIEDETVEEDVEEMSLAEFGESILKAEPDHDAPESGVGGAVPEIEGKPDDDNREDWRRLEEILEPAEPEPESSPEHPGPDDAAAALEPVLEAAEEYAGRGAGEVLDIEGRDDPGPAFGGEHGGRGGVYLEDNFLASVDESAAKSSTKPLLVGSLAVVVIVAAWLGWSYMSGGWPFTDTTARADSAALQGGDTPPDQPGEISDAELEAVVSAAVDAVVQHNENADPVDEAATTETGDVPEVTAVAATASVIEELRWEPRTQGTVIVIRADGALDESRVKVEPLSSPPRILIRLKGIVEAYRPLEIVVDSADVQLMRIGHHPEKRPPSLWVVLDVSGPAVAVRGVEVEGDTARVLVGR